MKNLNKDDIKNLEDYIVDTSSSHSGLLAKMVIEHVADEILTTNKDGINGKEKQPQAWKGRITKRTTINGDYVSTKSYKERLYNAQKKIGGELSMDDIVVKDVKWRQQVEGFKTLHIKTSSIDTDNEEYYLMNYVENAKKTVEWFIDGKAVSFAELNQTLGSNIKGSAFSKSSGSQVQKDICLQDGEFIEPITPKLKNITELKVGDFHFSQQ